MLIKPADGEGARAKKPHLLFALKTMQQQALEAPFVIKNSALTGKNIASFHAISAEFEIVAGIHPRQIH
jgi:hypothetical protein